MALDDDDDDEDFRPPGFTVLANKRAVTRPDLPVELREFYATNEGVGLSGRSDRPVRFAKLDEVRQIGWTDAFGSQRPPHAGWGALTALKIGRSDYGDEIVLAISVPGIPSGSVLAIGEGAMMGPAGNERDGPQNAIVLAACFADWVAQLRKFGAVAHGIYLDMEDSDLEDRLKARLAKLNPHSKHARRR